MGKNIEPQAETEQQPQEQNTTILSGHCQIHHDDLKAIFSELCSATTLLSVIDSDLKALNKLFENIPKALKWESDPGAKMFEMMLQKIIDAEMKDY